MIDDTTRPEHSGDAIRADRACIGCGFNLFGQTVSKEPHYGLAIATCPECGTVASLQSYPTMSHWANRFRALIAAVWIFALMFVFILQMSLVGTMADSISRNASDRFAKEIGQQYETWAQENDVPIQSPFGIGPSQYPEWNSIPNDWAEDHVDTIYQEMGGHFRAMVNKLTWYFFPASIASFMFGVFWSNALLGASLKGAAAVSILTCLFALVLMYLPSMNWGPNSTTTQALEIANEYYRSYLAFAGVIIQLPALVLGVFLGRKIARFVIAFTLPPRSRVPFSIFWTRDGLELPSAK